jgi:hypothetical protein
VTGCGSELVAPTPARPDTDGNTWPPAIAVITIGAVGVAVIRIWPIVAVSVIGVAITIPIIASPIGAAVMSSPIGSLFSSCIEVGPFFETVWRLG